MHTIPNAAAKVVPLLVQTLEQIIYTVNIISEQYSTLLYRSKHSMLDKHATQTEFKALHLEAFHLR